MRFPFNERKAAQMAARLLQSAGGQLDVIVLIKLMYLCDRRALVDRGLPITGAYMVSMPWGPVLSEVLDDINLGERPEAYGDGHEWQQFVGERIGNVVKAISGADSTDQLSRYELRVIDETFAEFGSIPTWDLVDLTHDLPEWEDPGRSSRPILPETILRAEGRSDEDIDAVAGNAEDFWLMSRIA